MPELNIPNILALAELIERQPHTRLRDKTGFNMLSYTHYCGTPACIAGWAAYCALGSEDLDSLDEAGPISAIAAEWLGLEPESDKPHNLFLYYPGDPSPQQAAQVLRHLAATGEVDWRVAIGRDGEGEEE